MNKAPTLTPIEFGFRRFNYATKAASIHTPRFFPPQRGRRRDPLATQTTLLSRNDKLGIVRYDNATGKWFAFLPFTLHAFLGKYHKTRRQAILFCMEQLNFTRDEKEHFLHTYKHANE